MNREAMVLALQPTRIASRQLLLDKMDQNAEYTLCGRRIKRHVQ
jgi:hypothetical protein